MKEIIIHRNESNQRIDKFLRKYFSNAPLSFIFKMLRKKRIKLNGKKAQPKDIINEGDKIQLYLSEDTINKFKRKIEIDKISIDIDIIYEDKNIILFNKPKGILSHSDGGEEDNSVVKQMVSYLHLKGEYDPDSEKTFVPAICNRLDRNTSGIIIGAKNFNTLQGVNEAIRTKDIKKYYKCIVKGRLKSNKELKGYLIKDERENKVYISDKNIKGSKEIHTHIRVLKSNDRFSLLEIDLITGRTHQIRAHLSTIGYPIIGDQKYGDRKINDYFKKKYGLTSQYLHAYKIVFQGLTGDLDYLNEKQFTAEIDKKLLNIENDIFV